MTEELWSTERCRAELGAASIRSVSVLLARKGIEAVSREPGRVGMNLYPAAAVREAFNLTKPVRVIKAVDFKGTDQDGNPAFVVTEAEWRDDDAKEKP